MKIKNMLSKDVLKLAENYLKKGDLWEFLLHVDDKLKRLNKEIISIETREDELAETFITKLLVKRCHI